MFWDILVVFHAQLFSGLPCSFGIVQLLFEILEFPLIYRALYDSFKEHHYFPTPIALSFLKTFLVLAYPVVLVLCSCCFSGIAL